MKRALFAAALLIAFWLGLFAFGDREREPSTGASTASTANEAAAAPASSPLDRPALSRPPRGAPPVVGREFRLGGIQINEPDLGRWLDRLAGAGFNTISLTAYARHGPWNGSDLSFGRDPGWLVPEVRGAKERNLAVVLFLRVALEHSMPENRFLWHGLIMPRSDADVRNFFARYTEYVLLWARMAEREGIDVLGLGSELNTLAATAPVAVLPALEEYYLNPRTQALERERLLRAARDLEPGALEHQLEAGWGERYDRLDRFLDDRARAQEAWAREVTRAGSLEAINQRRALLDLEWRRLIRAVREQFRGRLTYAANFDQYRSVGFWSELDLVGINAYFPLRGDLEPRGDDELLAGFERSWRRELRAIDAHRRAIGLAERPVLFTELGYTRARGATLEPWAGDGLGIVRRARGAETDADLVVWRRQPLGPNERALAVRAFCRAALERPEVPGLLAGLLYWKLSTVAEHQQIEPFVLVLDRGDPLQPELLRCVQLPAKSVPREGS